MKCTKWYDVARPSYLHYWRYHCWNKLASGVSFAGALGRIKKKWFDPLFLDQCTLSCELKSKFNKSNKPNQIQGLIRNNHKNGYWMHGGKCISQFIQALAWFENCANKMSLLALSCVPYIIEDALFTKLLCLYHTSNSWHTTPFFQLLQKFKMSFYSCCNLSLFTLPVHATHSFT